MLSKDGVRGLSGPIAQSRRHRGPGVQDLAPAPGSGLHVPSRCHSAVCAYPAAQGRSGFFQSWYIYLRKYHLRKIHVLTHRITRHNTRPIAAGDRSRSDPDCTLGRRELPLKANLNTFEAGHYCNAMSYNARPRSRRLLKFPLALAPSTAVETVEFAPAVLSVTE